MVREYLQAQNAPILPELKKFYDQHRVKDDPSRNLGQYISLALMVGSPPDFKLTVPDAELPPDARDVVGFLPLLRTYYAQTKMLIIWSQVQKQYEAAVARYTDAVRQNFVLTEAYMRFPRGGYLGRTYAIYIDLMGAPEQVHARIYGLNYLPGGDAFPGPEARGDSLSIPALSPGSAGRQVWRRDRSEVRAPHLRARRRPCWDWTSRRILVCWSRSA